MTGSQQRLAITSDFRQCRQYTRHYARTFYFASHVLPAEKRLAAYAVYAFCRRADEIADSAEAVSNVPHAKQHLARLRDELRRVYEHGEVTDPTLRAFRSTVARYDIPQVHFVDLLRGVEMDLEKSRYASFTELEEYCYCVASTVGLVMTRIFGVQDESAFPFAIALGKAMQLTNILRDVGEDYRRGRIYIPADELERFGVPETDVEHGVVTDHFAGLMRFHIERARSYYEHAEPGVPLLTNDGSRFCVKLMSRTYARILDVIEANRYDVLTRRAFVPLAGKFSIALRAAFKNETGEKPDHAHLRAAPAMQPLPRE